MTKHDVLALLRSQDGPLSGQAIAEALHVSRTAVWKAVGTLQREGYRIDSLPRRGYVLVQSTDRLSAHEIQNHLEGHPWAQTVTVLDSVDDELAQLTIDYIDMYGAELKPASSTTEGNSRLDVEIRYSRTGLTWLSFLVQARTTFHRALIGQDFTTRTYDMTTGQRILMTDLFEEDS